MAAPPGTKRIVFWTMPPLREIDLVGPADVFAIANQVAGGRPLYEIKGIGAEPVRGGGIAGMSGLSLSCDGDYRSFRGEIDTLLVPGGRGAEERVPGAAASARSAPARSSSPTPGCSTGGAPRPIGRSPPSWRGGTRKCASIPSRSGSRTATTTPRRASLPGSTWPWRCWRRTTGRPWRSTWRAASPLSPRPRLYVVCNQDRTIRPSWQRHAARKWLRVDPVEIECGHFPQLAMPERLAALLQGFLEMPPGQSPLAES